MTNILTSIPPRARAATYLVFALIGVGLGATQVGFQAAEAGFPVWLKVALSVYAFLGTALGLTAAANTPSYQDVVEGEVAPAPTSFYNYPKAPSRNERGAVDPLYALVVVLVAVVLLVVLFRLL